MTIYVPPDFQMDPNTVKRIGVISGGGLHVFTHTHPGRGAGVVYALTPTPLASLAEPGALATQLVWSGVSAVWSQDPGGWPALSAALLASPDHLTHELSSDGQLCGVVVQQRGEGGRGKGVPIGVYAPFVNDAWGIWSLARGLTPRALAEGLALTSHLLNMQLRFSPSYTGLTMLRQTLGAWEARNGALPELSPEWRERLDALRPTYGVWRQPLAPIADGYDPADTSLEFSVYDRNSSFVSSAREVGVGDPVPTDEYRPSRPGVYWVTGWRASGITLSTIATHGLPGPFRVGDGIGDYPLEATARDLPGLGGVWAWEPQIRHALRWGFEFTVEAGYYWPKRGDVAENGYLNQVHDLFRPWQGRLWEARNAARAARNPLAEALVKKIGVSTIGRLVQREGRAVVSTEQAAREGLPVIARETDAYGELTGRAEVEMALGRTDLIQPGWWSTIIANANERLWNAVYSSGWGSRCLLAYIDGVYLDAPSDALDGPRDKPGGWRSQGTVHIPRGDVARLDTLAAGELVKALARYERERDEAAANGE